MTQKMFETFLVPKFVGANKYFGAKIILQQFVSGAKKMGAKTGDRGGALCDAGDGAGRPKTKTWNV